MSLPDDQFDEAGATLRSTRRARARRRVMAVGALSRRPSFRQTFGSLTVRPFRHWFASQLVSASGTMTQSVALSWLVLKITGSGVDLGLLTTCTFLPMLVSGPWSGNLVDRSNRRRLLIVTQSLFIALSTLLAIMIALGAVRVWMLFLIALASGIVGAPDAAARQVYAVDLVGTDHLSSAISLNEVVINVSRVLGPLWAAHFWRPSALQPVASSMQHPLCLRSSFYSRCARAKRRARANLCRARTISSLSSVRVA